MLPLTRKQCYENIDYKKEHWNILYDKHTNVTNKLKSGNEIMQLNFNCTVVVQEYF